MFLYEGDCLKNITEIRGIRYVTVSHYSGDTVIQNTAMNAKISIERPRHPSLPTTSGHVFESHRQLQKTSKTSVFDAFLLQKR